MKKDGSFDSLIYNDALFRNKQHVLNPKMINAPETWVSKFVNLIIRHYQGNTQNKFENDEIFRN